MHRYSWWLLNFVPSFWNSNLKAESRFSWPAPEFKMNSWEQGSLVFKHEKSTIVSGKWWSYFTLDSRRKHALLPDNRRTMPAQIAPTIFSTGSLFDQIWTRMRLECFWVCRPPKHHQTQSLGLPGDSCYGFWPLGTLYEPPKLPKWWFCLKSAASARQPILIWSSRLGYFPLDLVYRFYF